MGHYKDGQCYPNGGMGMSEHPAGLKHVGLTEANSLGGGKKYRHEAGDKPMSHESMLPAGGKGSHDHNHRSASGTKTHKGSKAKHGY